MRFDVELRFDRHLTKRFEAKPDIAKFLTRHDRKTVCIDNLCTQIRLAELSLRRKMSTHSYQLLIESTADMFAQAALKAKEVDLMSAAEAARRRAEASREQSMQAEFDDLQKEANSTAVTSYPTIAKGK